MDVAFTGLANTTRDPRPAAHLTVATGPATPSDIGDVGVFFESGDGSERYCADHPPLPTRDTFWNQMGADAVTGCVVLDRAVTPSTPEGRGDVSRRSSCGSTPSATGPRWRGRSPPGS